MSRLALRSSELAVSWSAFGLRGWIAGIDGVVQARLRGCSRGPVAAAEDDGVEVGAGLVEHGGVDEVEVLEGVDAFADAALVFGAGADAAVLVGCLGVFDQGQWAVGGGLLPTVGGQGSSESHEVSWPE